MKSLEALKKETDQMVYITRLGCQEETSIASFLNFY